MKKIYKIELVDLEGDEETPIKWRDFEIETLVAVQNGMDNEFHQLTRKQGMKKY